MLGWWLVLGLACAPKSSPIRSTAPPPDPCAKVSGQPVETQINEAIGELYRRMDRDRYRIIGVGGVFTAEDAYRKIRLGASLVQVMTVLVYEGPGAVRAINRGLCRLLERDGFATVAEAIGTANRPRPRRTLTRRLP